MVGSHTGYNNKDGMFNVYIGDYAGYNSGYNTYTNETISQNEQTFIGYSAVKNVRSKSTIIGSWAGYGGDNNIISILQSDPINNVYFKILNYEVFIN